MTQQEIETKQREFERELRQLKERQADEARRDIRRRTDAFEKDFGVHVGISDDYATLLIGAHGPSYDRPPTATRFYYGYEETTCPTHGRDGSACGEADCQDGEWTFVVKVGNEEIYSIPSSGLHPECRDMAESLLCGIGMWLSNRAETKQ